LPLEEVPVTFNFSYPYADKIHLAGPFNHWIGEPMDVIEDGHHHKKFELTKLLHPGDIQYKFIVFYHDGHHNWQYEHGKPTHTDGHGHVNNVIHVKPKPVEHVPEPAHVATSHVPAAPGVPVEEVDIAALEATVKPEALQRWRHFFDKCDVDKSGEIGYVEFLAESKRLNIGLSEEGLLQKFREKDINHDGVISWGEFLVTMISHQAKK